MPNMVDWKVLETTIDPHGSFTHQINWVPPTASRFIVQYVSVDDPLHLLPNYVKPYYEAWRVEDGKVVYDMKSADKYDDSFTNCLDGFICKSVAEDNREKIIAAGVDGTYVEYDCLVYWIDEEDAADVKNWKTGDIERITMAGKLKASWNPPSHLGEETTRVFRAVFTV